MEEKDKFEVNKRHNAPFLRALDVLMKEKNINQAQAAELLETKSGTFSDYKRGKKKVGPEMFGRIACAFCGRLNMHYLTGESEYMMLANVPDEEILEYSMRDGNPDYDVLKKAKAANTEPIEPSTANIPDMSSVFNSALAKADEAIEQLKMRLAEKDELIKALREQIAEKDQRITEQKERLTEYRRKIDSHDIGNYPFHIGSAESEKVTTNI